MSSIQIVQYRDGDQRVIIDGKEVIAFVDRIEPASGKIPAIVNLTFYPDKLDYFFDNGPREGR